MDEKTTESLTRYDEDRETVASEITTITVREEEQEELETPVESSLIVSENIAGPNYLEANPED
jgi:hypothetical protein